MIRMKVVLPAPFGPNKPKMEPSGTETLIFSIATCPAYALLTFSARKIGSDNLDGFCVRGLDQLWK